jgi:phosphoribosylpyrophosphate synthetase
MGNDSLDTSQIAVSITANYVITYDLHYQEVDGFNNITVVGSDGIICVTSPVSYFYVRQTSDADQTVVFKGLPDQNSVNYLQSGALYTENGTLKIKE